MSFFELGLAFSKFKAGRRAGKEVHCIQLEVRLVIVVKRAILSRINGMDVSNNGFLCVCSPLSTSHFLQVQGTSPLKKRHGSDSEKIADEIDRIGFTFQSQSYLIVGLGLVCFGFDFPQIWC